MKKILLTLIAITMATFVMGQKNVQVVKSDMHHLQVEYRTGEVLTTTTEYDGNLYSIMSIEGYGYSNMIGAPMMPMNTSIIEIPICGEIKCEIVEAQYDTLDLSMKHIVMPTQPSRCKSDFSHHDLEINHEIYAQDKYFALPLVQVNPMGIARDKRLAKLSFSPMQYNPQTGKVIICKGATIQINYQNVDEKETLNLKKYSTPSFTIGHDVLNSLNLSSKVSNTASPVRMVIVSHPMFRDSLDEYIAWKQRKGFIVDTVFLDDPNVGTASTAIQSYIKEMYTNATAVNPAPTYVLLIGDVAQVPTCADKHPADGFWGAEHHPTDLYYAEWTNDMIPDAYYGRFSATNMEQLMPQIEKTLMYEQYTFEDPAFLDKAVLVAGIDDNFGRSHADPTVSQATKFYFNGLNGFSQVKCFQNNINVNPGGSNVTVSPNTNSYTVSDAYNEGAGWINYTAHGNINNWSDPSFFVSEVHKMRNTQKFGVMIGNCCLTNKFNEPECFGEALVRQGNYTGAVAYIGGSNYTYWSEDVYWSMGYRSHISSSMPLVYDAAHLGMYDQLFHLNDESHDKWITCLGGMIMAGNMSVESSNSYLSDYYWEVYHVMGDPSISPWLTQAEEMELEVSSVYTGATTATVSAVPYAYVAMTKGDTLISAAYADENGNVTLNFNGIEKGVYEVAASAMGYRTAFDSIDVHGVDIENAIEMKVGIYPNPVISVLTIESEGMQDVEILSATGCVMMHQRVDSNSIKMDVQSLSNGVYFVKVRTLDKVIVRKFIKE